MQKTWTRSEGNHKRHPHRPRTALHLALVLVLAASCTLLGCGGGGGDNGGNGGGGNGNGGTSINDFVNPMVAETLMGLNFAFTEGDVFHAALAGTETTVTFDTATDTTITVTLATADQMAQGEIILPSCDGLDILSGFCGPYDVTITDSDFPPGTGPQEGDVLELQDWRIFASTQNCANGVSVTLIVEDVADTAVTSATLDLDGSSLSPLICAGA